MNMKFGSVFIHSFPIHLIRFRQASITIQHNGNSYKMKMNN